MSCVMTDHIAALKELIGKAEAKVQRYQKSLETATSELSDLQTALRVFEGIVNNGDSNVSGTSSTVGRQLEIVRLLRVGEGNGKQPADLYAEFCLIGSEDISIDTFRTTIWRMKGKVFEVDETPWEVRADAGAYWKVDASSMDRQQDLTIEELLGRRATQNENEPRSGNAGGSDPGEREVRTFPKPWEKPHSSQAS